MTRTLVVHTGGIGDFLLACPALRVLAEAGPVELAGHPERHALAVAAGIARAAHGLDAIEFHSLFAQPSEKLVAFLRGFDRVVVWMRDADGSLRRGIDACGVSRVDVFPGLPQSGFARHASEYYAECLGMAAPPPLRLAIAPVGAALDVVIHPGSGSLAKNWPVENFRAVAGALAARGRGVTWIAGPAEDERDGTAGEEYGPGATLRDVSLLELARRLAGARLYLGNDSGVTHLAAALGVPTLAIFGPSDPCVWAPRGEWVRVVRGGPWPAEEEVLSIARALEGGSMT